MHTFNKINVDDRHSKRDLQHSVRSILQQSRRAALISSASLVMLAAGEARSQQTGSPSADSSSGAVLEEITVTAQSRTQSLQDVPYNISTITGDSLRDAGLTSIDSLTQVVPGLMNVDQGPAARGGNNNFIMRGLRADAPGGGSAGAVFQNLTVSPVSTYYGETPVFFKVPTDDLERVEVLRGPQGTLYGSGSQAGTIRFIPKRPVFDKFSGEVTAEGSYTEYAPNGNGSIHGILNIPIADHLALRVNAGEDHLGGFISAVDRVQLTANGTPVPSIPGNLESGFVLGPIQRGTNTSDQQFVRAALRWQPNDAVDTQFDFLHQHTVMKDAQWGSALPGGPFDSSFGAWPNATVDLRPGCNHCTTGWTGEPYSDNFNLVDFVATVDMGLGTFTSSSSFSDDKDVTSFDQTGLYYGTPSPPSPASQFIAFYPYNNYPRLDAYMRSPTTSQALTQELRFTSKQGTTFDYVAGLYYQRVAQKINLTETVNGITAYDDYSGQHNPTTYGDIIYFFDRNTVFQDRAAFGELTYHPTSAWQITGGARVFQQPFKSQVTVQLPLCGAICAYNQTDIRGLEPFASATTFSSHIWKLNTSYDFSTTLKVYATFSEGFRRGGVSGLPFDGPYASEPYLETFKPDLAKNYEIGIKGSLLDRRIDYFGDVYLVNLNNFQFDGQNLASAPGAFNGSQARSQGAEFEAHMALTQNLRVSIGYAFTRAYVAKSFAIIDYLPYALVPSQGGTGQTTTLYSLNAGTPLPGVSRNVGNAAVDYTVPTQMFSNGQWNWRMHLDGAYRSSQNSNIDPSSIFNFVIPSALLSNASISLQSEKTLSYTFTVRNITNNSDITGGENDQQFANPFRLRNVGRPRTFALSVRYQFGSQ